MPQRGGPREGICPPPHALSLLKRNEYLNKAPETKAFGHRHTEALHWEKNGDL